MKNQLVPFNVKVKELNKLTENKAIAIVNGFKPFAAELSNYDDDYDAIIKESEKEITEELSKKAREVRLKLVPIRTGTGKEKDSQKASIKIEDKAIMGVHNFLVDTIKEKEDKLLEIEKHQERIEQQRIADLAKEREEELEPYKEFVTSGNLGALSEEDYNKVYNGAKLQFEEAERLNKIEEEKRKEEERLDRLTSARQMEIASLTEFLTYTPNLREMEEEDYIILLEDLKAKKSKYDSEQEEIRKENEKLRKQQELADKKAKEEKDRQDAILEKERKEKERLQAELQAKKDKEVEELRLAEEAKQKELSKSDKEKVEDLKQDLLSLKTKYEFDSEKYKSIYGSVNILLQKIISHINDKEDEK